MGCWSIDSFGNDTAADWLADLVAGETLELLDETLDAVLRGGDDYLEAPAAAEALAAAELAAALLGRPGPLVSANEELSAWVGRNTPARDAGLAQRAIAAIDRILGERSELAELWDETVDRAAWRAGLGALRARLAA